MDELVEHSTTHDVRISTDTKGHPDYLSPKTDFHSHPSILKIEQLYRMHPKCFDDIGKFKKL